MGIGPVHDTVRGGALTPVNLVAAPATSAHLVEEGQPDERRNIFWSAEIIVPVMVEAERATTDNGPAAQLSTTHRLLPVWIVLAMVAGLGWFYLQLLPGWLGLPTTSAEFSVWAITGSVLVFLGIPLLAGIVGPLIEVPALVGLVYVALWVRPRFTRSRASTPPPGTVSRASADTHV